MVVSLVCRVRRVVMMRVAGRVSSSGLMLRIGVRMPIVRMIGRVFGTVFLAFIIMVVSMVRHRIDSGHNQQNKARTNQKLHFSGSTF